MFSVKHRLEIPVYSRPATGGGSGTIPNVTPGFVSTKGMTEEQRKELQQQQAIDAINAVFGIAPSTATSKDVQSGAVAPDALPRGGMSGFAGELNRGLIDFARFSSGLGPNDPLPINGATKPTTVQVPAYAARLPRAPKAGELLTADLSDAERAAIEEARAANPNFLTERPDIARRLRYAARRSDFVGKQKSVLDRNLTDSLRQLGFALARQGLSGGSVDVDKRADADRLYKEGLGVTTAAGEQLVSQLAAADEQSRQSLIARAEGGASESGLRADASQALMANELAANNESVSNAIANLFGGLTAFNEQSVAAKQRRDAQRDFGAFFPQRTGARSYYSGTTTKG